jgi:hypothetical protein
MRTRLYHCLAAVALSFGITSCSEPAGPVPVATVVITPGQRTLRSLGESVQLSAVAKDASGNEIPGKVFTWSTAAPGVATVDQAALATAIANGQTTVTAAVDGIEGTVSLVVAQTVASVAVDPVTNPLASIGETVQLTATAKDALNNPIADKPPIWGSSAEGLVSVTAVSGVARAKANGSATITAMVDGVSGSTGVTVAQKPVKLAFVNQPVHTQNGIVIPSITVAVQDSLGTTVPSASNQVRLGIGTNPAGGGLSGIEQVTASNGIASFTGLSINNAGAQYRLSATAAGLADGTSASFDVLSVPARVDSLKLASSTLKVGGSIQYSVWVTAGRNLTAAGTQAYIVQTITNGAGGATAIGCSGTFGGIPHGTCKFNYLAFANSGSVKPGPATMKIDFYEGSVTLGTISIPITIVP